MVNIPYPPSESYEPSEREAVRRKRVSAAAHLVRVEDDEVEAFVSKDRKAAVTVCGDVLVEIQAAGFVVIKADRLKRLLNRS